MQNCTPLYCMDFVIRSCQLDKRQRLSPNPSLPLTKFIFTSNSFTKRVSLNFQAMKLNFKQHLLFVLLRVCCKFVVLIYGAVVPERFHITAYHMRMRSIMNT